MREWTRCIGSFAPVGKRIKNKKRFARMLVIAVVAAVALLGAAYLMGRVADRLEYRLDYKDELIEAADRYGLDRRLIAAVIHTESSNRSGVYSPAGAVGLMQLMPDTAGWIAEKQGREDYSEEQLLTPEVNIDLGCWYLSYLLDRYGNQRCAVAAYNAGPGNVDKWLSDERYGAGGALIAVPFKETEEYLLRIDRAYEKYTDLYEKELG